MRRAGMVRVLAAVMAVGLLQALAPVAPARAAEDVLVASDPYRHEQLDAPPSGVTLAFTRAVDAEQAQIIVTNSAGQNVNINSLIVEGTNVQVQMRPNLPKDTFTVHYQVNRKDGDIEGGAFQFSYGKGNWTKLADERWSGSTAQPTVLASPDAVPTPTPTATETPVETETPVATPSPAETTPAATATFTPAPADGDSGTNPWPWAGLGALVVAGAVGGFLFVRRNGRGSGDAQG